MTLVNQPSRQESSPFPPFPLTFLASTQSNTITSSQGDWDAIWNAGNLVSPDFEYAKSDGTIFPRGKASWDGVTATYQFFTKWYHEPYFFTAFELDDGSGYALNGSAQIYYNLPGDATGAGVKDAQGRQWQGKIPGGFYFEYKKDQGGKDGLKITSTAITSDTGPIVVQLLQRGVLKPSDLGL